MNRISMSWFCFERIPVLFLKNNRKNFRMILNSDHILLIGRPLISACIVFISGDDNQTIVWFVRMIYCRYILNEFLWKRKRNNNFVLFNVSISAFLSSGVIKMKALSNAFYRHVPLCCNIMDIPSACKWARQFGTGCLSVDKCLCSNILKWSNLIFIVRLCRNLLDQNATCGFFLLHETFKIFGRLSPLSSWRSCIRVWGSLYPPQWAFSESLLS